MARSKMGILLNFYAFIASIVAAVNNASFAIGKSTKSLQSHKQWLDSKKKEAPINSNNCKWIIIIFIYLKSLWITQPTKVYYVTYNAPTSFNCIGFMEIWTHTKQLILDTHTHSWPFNPTLPTISLTWFHASTQSIHMQGNFNLSV